MSQQRSLSAAQVLVEKFIAYGIEYIFFVPGASIDPILDVLHDKTQPKLILCHHESTAGYMAAAYGKITGRPAVVMATAGPGATNLTSAIATAESEEAPMIAISGQMSSRTSFKPTHQVIDAAAMFRPISKWSHEVSNVETLASVWDLAYQQAVSAPGGVVHLAIASDVLAKPVVGDVDFGYNPHMAISYAGEQDLCAAAVMISEAKSPLIIVGGGAANDAVAEELQNFLSVSNIPVVCTFEGAGMVTREHQQLFMGRLGVFQNQPCNHLIRQADVIICLGYNIAELDPILWNKGTPKLVHIHQVAPIVDDGYRPDLQLIGDIQHSLQQLAKIITPLAQSPDYVATRQEVRRQLDLRLNSYNASGNGVHPLQIIAGLEQVLSDKNTVTCDVGSHQYWMSEYYFSYRPRYFLSSMGFQTMGVSLPFAIAAALVRKEHKVVSVSGDGSFLMCMMELATAVKLDLPIIHLVWKDRSFNLVQIQEEKKYQRSTGAIFESDIDFAKLAESFGATGMRVKTVAELLPALNAAMACRGVVVIEVSVDYSDNASLVRNSDLD